MDANEYHAGYHISLTGAVNHDMLKGFEGQVKAYFEQSEADREPIVLTISSRGGSISMGITLFEQVRLLTQAADVTGVAVGRCMSAAVTILLALPKERRLTTKNTVFLIHQTHYDRLKIPAGTLDVRQAQVGELLFDQELAEYDFKWVVGVIARACNQSKRQIKKLCVPGAFFDAKQAIELGLVSGTVG